MSKIKSSLKAILTEVQHQKYNRELSSQKVDYDSWIRGQEAPLLLHGYNSDKEDKCLKIEMKKKSYETALEENDGKISKNEILCSQYELKGQKGKLELLEVEIEELEKLLPQTDKIEEKVILLLINKGTWNEIAFPLIYDAFLEEEERCIVYGDEDILVGEKREQPWLKPDWSPDTFLSGFYFGSMVCISTDKLKKLLVGKNYSQKVALYEVIADLIKENGGFDTWKNANRAVFHIPQVLYHTKQSGYELLKDWKLSEDKQLKLVGNLKVNFESSLPTVSVIIPSKDHPEILFRCLDSFVEKTTNDIYVDNYFKYEFVIVDNGSDQANRKRIEQKVDELNKCSKNKGATLDNARYIYEICSFNFSKMCNLGAAEATGDYLLFLNDDMEIIEPDWLTKMMKKATLSYVGAVGAKLLYPGTDVIQHAGITNLRVGPAHKLQFLHDTEEHYFGKNRGVHDVLGVTGACLLVRRDVFEQVGGFDEQLAVAFNDVDLCYKIYEAGYYNVVRNDVVLYHHESLSRGKDGESTEKQQRLLREKDYLYAHHQNIYGKAPVYHPYWTTDMLEAEDVPAYHYQVDLSIPYARVCNRTKEVASARLDECLVVGMECAMDIYKWKYGVEKDETDKSEGYYFQGYAFVIGSDNACYERELLLRKYAENTENPGNQTIYGLPVINRYREDIKDNLHEQLNVDLTGFVSKLRTGDIPAGTYQFGMIARDKCSRVKLVNWSSWTIEIPNS